MQKKNRKLLLSNIKTVYNLWKHCKCVSARTHIKYDGLNLICLLVMILLCLCYSYHDRLAMIAEAIEKEQKEAQVRERAQQQVHRAKFNFDVVYLHIYNTSVY